MIKFNNYLGKIKSFCDFNIEYDRSNKTYLFNNQYLDDIDCNEFEDSIIKLQSELIDVLIDIKKPQNYIKNVLKEIEKIAIWYETERIKQFENFDKLSKLIVHSKGNQIKKSNSKYTIEQVKTSSEDLEINSDEMFFYLILNKSKTKNYRLKSDYQKVKLHYVVTKYFESIYSFIEYLLMLDEIEEKYGIEDLNQFRPLPKPQLKCNIKLSKIETANLFNAFFITGYFYFDILNENQYKKAKIKFIENNFNYINQHGKLSNIGNLVKEFGEIETFNYAENQIKVIGSLIDKLKEIQSAIKLEPKTKKIR